MTGPTSDGWTAPGQQPGTPRRQDPPAPQAAPQPPPQPEGWQGHPGWGGPAAPQPAAPAQAAGWQAVPGWQGAAGGWGAPAPDAPRPGVVPLRPLGLGELLDGAVGLVRGYPRPVLVVSAAVALVTTLVQLLLVLTLLQPLFDVDTTALAAGDTDALLGLVAGAVGASSVTLVLSTLSGAVMTGFLTGVAGRAVLGQPLALDGLWAAVRPRLGRLVGVAALFGLAVYGPLLLAGALAGLLVAVGGAAGAVLALLTGVALVVLGVLAYVRLSLAPSVAVLEDAPAAASLRRSWGLVRGSTWRVFGVLLLAVVVAAFVGQVLQLPFALLAGDGGPLGALSGEPVESLSTRALVLSTIGGGIATTVVAPFTAGVTALLYVDRRMRAEGLDVALQAAAATGP